MAAVGFILPPPPKKKKIYIFSSPLLTELVGTGQLPTPGAPQPAQGSPRVPIGHREGGGDTEQSPRRQQHPPAVARASIKASADPTALV